MPSVASRVLTMVTSVVGARTEYRDPDVVRRKVEQAQVRPPSFGPPRRMERTCAVGVDFRRGWACYRITPPDGATAMEVLYLHGGAYIEQIGAVHWRLVERLATALRARVSVPVYPLAPRGTAAEVVPEVTALARELLDRDAGPVALAGDSAGGGLALAAAQHLRDEGGRQPARMILIAPWLDVTMRNPDIPLVGRYDPELSRAALRFAGRLWAGGIDPADPRASPVNGDLDALPPTTVFIGTRDELDPDTRRFRDRARRAGAEVEFVEAPGQIHAYPLYRIPEGREARDRIISVLDRLRAA